MIAIIFYDYEADVASKYLPSLVALRASPILISFFHPRPAMPTVFYLAYGSNLHPQRLAERVPSARVVGVVEMPGHRLAFHKRSIDGSGKCLIYPELGQHHNMYGVLYEFDEQDTPGLDEVEGKGQGYENRCLRLSLRGEIYSAFVYDAQATHIDPGLVPYHWYKDFVLAGARYHGFPAEYIASIEATSSKPDLNDGRRRGKENLLEQMKQA